MRTCGSTTAFTLFTVIAAGLLSACSGTAEAPVPGSHDDVTGEPGVPGTSQPAPNDGCDLDLASTAFGPYTALRQIPTINANGGAPEEQFWAGYPLYRFTIADNSFDPCADLSWIRLAGTTESDTPAEDVGAAPGTSNAIVLFHRDKLITAPLPVPMAENVQVSRTADNTLEITFGHYAPPGEVVTQELRTLHLRWEDNQLQLDDPTWYAEYAAARPQLDLTTPPPGSDAPVLPRGNVRTKPFEAEYELAPFPASNFRVPLTEGRELRCVLQFASDQPSWGWVGCLNGDATWPRVGPEYGFQPHPAPFVPATENPAATDTAVENTTNYLQISFLPTMLASTRVDAAAATDIPFGRTVPDEALTRVEHYVVDTRGEGVTISYGGAGVHLTSDGFETTSVHLIDQERWPW